MEYEIEEEDLLFDHSSSNPSLHPPPNAPGTALRQKHHRKEFAIPEEERQPS